MILTELRYKNISEANPCVTLWEGGEKQRKRGRRLKTGQQQKQKGRGGGWGERAGKRDWDREEDKEGRAKGEATPPHLPFSPRLCPSREHESHVKSGGCAEPLFLILFCFFFPHEFCLFYLNSPPEAWFCSFCLFTWFCMSQMVQHSQTQGVAVCVCARVCVDCYFCFLLPYLLSVSGTLLICFYLFILK